MKYKKGIPTLLILAGLLVVGFLVWQSGVLGSSLSVTGADVVTVPGEGIENCAVEDTTVTLRSYDLENKGVSTADTFHVWVNGDAIGTVADGSSLTASPGDEVQVLFGNDSETGVDGFYPTLVTETLGCTGTKTLSAFQKDMNSSAITVNLFNADDGLQNVVPGDSANLQSLDANGEETMEMKISTSSEDYFGDGSIIVVFSANQNAFSDVIIEGAKEVSTPPQYSATANNRAYAYEIPSLEGSKRTSYDVTLKGGATEPTASNGNVTIQVFDKCYYIDADTNTPMSGYADEDSNDLCAKTGTGAIYVN